MMDFKKERDSLVLGNDGLEAWLRSFAARVLRDAADTDFASNWDCRGARIDGWLERRASEIEATPAQTHPAPEAPGGTANTRS